MTTQPGAVSQNQDPALQREGLDSRTPIKERPKSARELLLEDIDSKIDAQREQDDETFYRTADPRAIAMAAEMRAEAAGEGPVDHNGRARTEAPARDPGTGRFVETADAGADGDPYPEGNPDIEQGADPLDEFIVREKGKPPQLKALVDGKVMLIPLDKARAQLQKQGAADARLRQVAEERKALDARARQIEATEASLRARAAQPPAPPVDDASIDAEATELVRSLVSEPEATAASKMAKVLKKIRASGPQIDVSAITRQAVSVAKEEIAAESTQRALVSGLSKFKTDYPDIAADPNLFALADRKTDAIAEEHPEWTPEQVMLEAGKQTQEWVATISGKRPATNGAAPDSRRQQAKQKLTPMPQSRSARPAPTDDANAPDDPRAALAEMRKQRGQAY